MVIEQNSLHNNHLSELSLCVQLPIFKVKVKVTELYPTLCDPMDYTVHGVLQVRILESVSIPFSMGFSQPRDRTQVSRLLAGSLPAEPPGTPKNTGLGSLSLLQWIFPTQKSSQGLLHCWQILYQMSCQ